MRGDDVVYEVLKYIHKNIEKHLELSDVANLFGYSKWHFCSKFHKYTGKSFVKYVRHYRLQLASLDILSGKKVTDVALEYGYETPGGLTEFGCLPREYKKHAKESQFYSERRKLSMYTLTDRCETLRQCVLKSREYQDYYFAQQMVYSSLGMWEAAKNNKSNMEIVTAGITNTLEKFMPVIMPKELIVGFNFSDGKDYGNYGEDTEENRALLKQNGISNEDINKFIEYSKEKPSLFEKIIPEISPEEKEANKEWSAIGRCIDSNHTVLDYNKVLKLGFRGILDEIAFYENKNGKSVFYDSLKSVCVAACNMGKKYVHCAEELKATIQALGYEADKLSVELVQMVRLIKDGAEFKMSKRTGNAMTIKELCQEVGTGSLVCPYC